MDRKKLLDNPTWDAGNVCVVCGNPNVQQHHVMYGTANRRKSTEYKYLIPLCAEHHTGGNGIHRNRGMALRWMELAQTHFERHKGTREEFIKVFGRSYL